MTWWLAQVCIIHGDDRSTREEARSHKCYVTSHLLSISLNKADAVVWGVVSKKICSLPKTCEHKFIGKKASCRCIVKKLKIRSSCIIVVDPKSRDNCHYNREKRVIHRHRRENYVKTKEDIRIGPQWVKKYLPPWPTVEESRNDSSLEPQEAA